MYIIEGHITDNNERIGVSMNKYYNKQEVELLAPAGTFGYFKEIIKSGADAVYFGGKKYNMRMHRQDYNLTNEEICDAVSMAHFLKKKVYVTFNNMMSDLELDEARDYLLFLQEVQPDALLIQDMGALSVIRELGIDIPIHASVMMNVHNKSMVDMLWELGITRVVMSREISLEKIHSLSKTTSMEFEYFVHGDMCIAHGAQCLYSGLIFGKSSNRGLCMKPCRWPYKLKDKNGAREFLEHHLAVKDMCMYRHIPQLIEAGVTSFKIEGRMRDSQYLKMLINAYRQAIDRYFDDPTGYYVDESMFSRINKSRTRNLSTGYAFKIPGRNNIDMKGEREAKIFSRAAEELEIDESRVRYIQKKSDGGVKMNIPLLTVKVNSFNGFIQALDNGADEVYLAGEVFRDDKPFTLQQIKEAVRVAKEKKVYVALPRMMDDRQLGDFKGLLNKRSELGVEGVVITNIGAISKLKSNDMTKIGDYSLNCYNSRSAEFYHKERISRITVSVEARLNVLNDILQRSDLPVEVMVQGAPVIMHLEHCVYAADQSNYTAQDCCPDLCINKKISLVDEKGFEHPVFTDQYCKNHMITSKDICLLPIINKLRSWGVTAFRIEGQHYTAQVLGKVVSIYRHIIDRTNEVSYEHYMNKIKAITGREQSLGALYYD